MLAAKRWLVGAGAAAAVASGAQQVHAARLLGRQAGGKGVEGVQLAGAAGETGHRRRGTQRRRRQMSDQGAL